MNNEDEIDVPDYQIIRGAFVIARRVYQKKLGDYFHIKLSAINTLSVIDGDPTQDQCLFYTFKDCCYYVEISVFDLQKAINSFIFEPEKHWESYGC